MAREYNTYHTHHRSRRLAGWDYTESAAYFVTICTKDRISLFGDVEEGRMLLNAYGRIAAEEWNRSEALRAEVHLDAFVIMPNHVHGIVVIAPPVEDAPTEPRGYDMRAAVSDANVASTGRSTLPKGPPPRSLGAFIAGYKSVVTKRINQLRQTPGIPVWQRRYHDHIIRNERSWRRIRQYIENNPARWSNDTHYSNQPVPEHPWTSLSFLNRPSLA